MLDNKNLPQWKEAEIVWSTMGSAYDQLTPDINWDEWSRVVEAVQDPRHRDAVQKFLARADLSAEVPAALDEKLLAPRRSEGATGVQCAYVLCNLGFASLAAATRGSAEFAIACGRLAEQMAPDTPDLVLRRHFLFAKGKLAIAALTDQPHLLWGDAAGRCTAYLRAIDQQLESLPSVAVESNAMAAFSFTAQFLSRIQKMNAVAYYAGEISRLVEVALGLSSRLPPNLVTRMWSTLMPGKDAGVLFREVGAMAERFLQSDGDSADPASRGLRYIDEILSERADKSAPDLERFLATRAELLLLSGRYPEAREQAEALEGSPDASVRASAVAIKARCDLNTGNPQAAAESLARHAPTAQQALESWHAAWGGDTGDNHWTDQAEAIPLSVHEQSIWRLQALAAADAKDMPGFLDASHRLTGFFVDSLLRDGEERVGPMAALDEVFGRLVDGTVLLQAIVTDEGILTWLAQKRDGDLSMSIAPERPDARLLTEAQDLWSRAYFDSLRHGAGSPENEAEGADTFAGLMNEVRRHWGDLLRGLVDDGVTQLVVIGDDLVDIPLHATRIGAGSEYLIDRVPVTYVPSLPMLRACIDRSQTGESQRKGIALRSLVDADLDPACADAIAAILETQARNLASPLDDSFWADVSAARVLHIAARASHKQRRPLESLLGPGWLDLSIGQLVAKLDLAQCEVVSNLHGESALPSTLRAPGPDLATVMLAAGAGSVLGSTWVTDDELASELAQTFFRHWVTRQAPSVAFRESLLSLRSRHPAITDFHWAGMRLVGAP